MAKSDAQSESTEDMFAEQTKEEERGIGDTRVLLLICFLGPYVSAADGRGLLFFCYQFVTECLK